MSITKFWDFLTNPDVLYRLQKDVNKEIEKIINRRKPIVNLRVCHTYYVHGYILKPCPNSNSEGYFRP